MARAPRNIRTPLKQRWRQLRYQFLPYVVFGATIAATVMLWQRHAGPSMAFGTVDTKVASITAAVPAPILPLTDENGRPVVMALNTVVAKGKQLVQLDTTSVEKQIAVAEAELDRRNDEIARIEQEVKVANDKIPLEVFDKKFRKWVEGDRLQKERRDLFSRVRDLESQEKVVAANKLQVDKEADDLETLLKGLKGFDQKEVLKRAGGETVASKRLAAKALKVQVDEIRKTIADLKGNQLDRIKEVLESLGNIIPPAGTQKQLDEALAPYRQAIVVQQKLIEQLENQKDSYVINAPFGGKITKIFKWPGQTVEPGDVIYEISKMEAEFITTYLRQGPNDLPKVNGYVNIRLRTRPPEVHRATVVEVGAKFEPVPLDHLRNPRIPEWGFPVRIEVPESLKHALRPGEKVDLTFSSSSAADGGGLTITLRDSLRRIPGHMSVIGTVQTVR